MAGTAPGRDVEDCLLGILPDEHPSEEGGDAERTDETVPAGYHGGRDTGGTGVLYQNVQSGKGEHGPWRQR